MTNFPDLAASVLPDLEEPELSTFQTSAEYSSPSVIHQTALSTCFSTESRLSNDLFDFQNFHIEYQGCTGRDNRRATTLTVS